MFALEVSADPERLASEGDPAVDIDLSDLVVEVILGLGEGLWEGAAAHGVPAGKCNQRQKWLRKSEQGDKWNRCLIEGMIVLSETGARDEQTTPP